MTATLLTADEYIASGASRPRWTQLINGEVQVNSPTIRHQKIVRRIEFAIESWTRNANGRGLSLGSIDVKFDDLNVLAPDVVWAAAGKIPVDGSHLEAVPDLVVEVRSPATWRYDTTVKFQKYQSAGVAEVWLVDTASQTVLVYRRSVASVQTFDEAYELAVTDVLRSPLLVDFALRIAEVFAE